MSYLTEAQKNQVIEATENVLRVLLSFHVSFSSATFVHDQAVRNYRDFEELISQDYPIKGIGVKATSSNLEKVDSDAGGFLHTEEPLFPGDVPAELQSFPFHAASAAYAFTLLEGYGDDILSIVNPGYLKERQAWHHGVYGDLVVSDPVNLEKGQKGFAKPFNVDPAIIPKFAVKRLVSIKKARNTFMHEGHAGIDFKEFFGAVVGTVAFLHFLVLPDGEELSVYPYEDLTGNWT